MLKPFRTKAVIRMDDAETVLASILDHMEEHAQVTRHESGARLTSPLGTVDVTRLLDTVLVDVTAGSAWFLGLIKGFVAEHVFEFAGETASITWSDKGKASKVPSQFQKVVVQRAFDITPRMRRVIFTCDSVDAYAGEAGYHVRLLLPQPGRVALWPSQSADGRIQWPEGDDALISRVYTIRSVDRADRTIAMDFVLHDGGHSPGADFAREAQPGDVVGLLGPGGEGLPPAGNLLLLGDEAALPAICRMLEDLPATAHARAFIEVEDEREEHKVVPGGQAAITWLYRRGIAPGHSDLLERAMIGHLDQTEAPDIYVWAGCEQKLAARLRQEVKRRAPEARGRQRIYAYWSLDDAEAGDALPIASGATA